jgi:hypothetical protein
MTDELKADQRVLRDEAGSNIAACWPPIDHGCWSVPERIQIQRIRYLCEKSPQLEFDGGQTDEGDPWFIVYDCERKQVLLHIARIDRRYVIVRASRPKPLTVAVLSAAINAALNELYHAGSDCRTA